MHRGLGVLFLAGQLLSSKNANMVAGEHGLLLLVLGTHADACVSHLLSHLCGSLERNLIPIKVIFEFVVLESQKECPVACKGLQ